MANPRAALAPGVFEETFSTGIIDQARWKSTSAVINTVDGNVGVLQEDNYSLDDGMLALKLLQVVATSGGSWNASTNSPALASSVGVQGRYYTVSTAGSTSLNGVGSWTVGQIAIFDGKKWHKVTSAPTYLSVGAELVTKKRFGYGTYEFIVRASSLAAKPNDAASAAPGSLTTVSTSFDAGAGGYGEISLQTEGRYQDANQYTSFSTEEADRSPADSKSNEAIGTDTGFWTLKWIWTADKIEFYLNSKLMTTHTEHIPTITGAVRLTHSGVNNELTGGFAEYAVGLPRNMFVSYFRYTPSSTNLARNSSFETVQGDRPYSYYHFLIAYPGDPATPPQTEWVGGVTGVTGGKAAALKALDPVPYIIALPPLYDNARRFGIRTAPWEDPDHPYPSDINTRVGIITHWQQGVHYTASFWAKKKSGSGANWLGMDLSWASPPNVRDIIESPTLTTSWQRYSFHFIWSNPVEPYGNFYINVVGDTAANDEIHIDDLQIYVKETYNAEDIRDYERDAEDVVIPVTVTPPSSGLPSRVLGAYFPAYRTTYNITDTPLEYNLIYIFNTEPTTVPQGSYFFPYYGNVQPSDIQICRARGQKCLLSIGGAGAAYFFNTRAKSNAFLTSFQQMYNNLGGLDGADFNNFEQFSIQYPRLSGGADNPAWAIAATEMTYIGLQLKSIYGSNFLITMPPHPGGGYAPSDRIIASTMAAAGALDYAGPQFYDSPDLIVPETIVSLIGQWVALIGADKVTVGFGANYALGSSLAQATSAWNTIKANHPSIRGLYCWNSETDLNGGSAFAVRMSSILA